MAEGVSTRGRSRRNASTRPEESTGGEAVGTPGASNRERRPEASTEGEAVGTPGAHTSSGRGRSTITLKQLQQIERAMSSPASPDSAGAHHELQQRFTADLTTAGAGAEVTFSADQVEAVVREAPANRGTFSADLVEAMVREARTNREAGYSKEQVKAMVLEALERSDAQAGDLTLNEAGGGGRRGNERGGTHTSRGTGRDQRRCFQGRARTGDHHGKGGRSGGSAIPSLFLQ